MFNEYKESDDKFHAKQELLSICNQYNIDCFMFVGYFLNNSLAEKPDDFRKYLGLVFQFFYRESELLDGKKLLER